eukprot:144009-Pyramimonas_sp.AAC.1
MSPCSNLQTDRLAASCRISAVAVSVRVGALVFNSPASSCLSLYPGTMSRDFALSECCSYDRLPLVASFLSARAASWAGWPSCPPPRAPRSASPLH